VVVHVTHNLQPEGCAQCLYLSVHGHTTRADSVDCDLQVPKSTWQQPVLDECYATNAVGNGGIHGGA
jgi:hypothetical protein